MISIRYFLWSKVWLSIYYFFNPGIFALWEGKECKFCNKGALQIELIALSADYVKLQDMFDVITKHFPKRYLWIQEETRAWTFKKDLIILD